MGFLGRLFGDRSLEPTPSHTVSITPEMAAAVLRIAHEQRLDVNELSILIGGNAPNGFTLDLTEDPAVRTSVSNAVAVSQGLTIIIPRKSVSDFDGMSVNYENGGFRFRGPTVPEFKASHPGKVKLSTEALFSLAPTMRTDPNAVERLAYHLEEGATLPALVASIDPLVIAAYAADLDAVVLLRFPQKLRGSLEIGSRLLAVNTYVRGEGTESDIVRGPGATRYFRNVTPFIADFFAANPDRVAERTAEIEEHYWARTAELISPAMARAESRYRDGIPLKSQTPAY